MRHQYGVMTEILGRAGAKVNRWPARRSYGFGRPGSACRGRGVPRRGELEALAAERVRECVCACSSSSEGQARHAAPFINRFAPVAAAAAARDVGAPGPAPPRAAPLASRALIGRRRGARRAGYKGAGL